MNQTFDTNIRFLELISFFAYCIFFYNDKVLHGMVVEIRGISLNCLRTNHALEALEGLNKVSRG